MKRAISLLLVAVMMLGWRIGKMAIHTPGAGGPGMPGMPGFGGPGVGGPGRSGTGGSGRGGRDDDVIPGEEV